MAQINLDQTLWHREILDARRVLVSEEALPFREINTLIFILFRNPYIIILLFAPRMHLIFFYTHLTFRSVPSIHYT